MWEISEYPFIKRDVSLWFVKKPDKFDCSGNLHTFDYFLTAQAHGIIIIGKDRPMRLM